MSDQTVVVSVIEYLVQYGSDIFAGSFLVVYLLQYSHELRAADIPNVFAGERGIYVPFVIVVVMFIGFRGYSSFAAAEPLFRFFPQFLPRD